MSNTGDITGVLLAAGAATRFGGHKLLASLNGQSLVAHSVAALRPCDHVIAVVRVNDDALLSLLQELDVDCVTNSHPDRGLGYSIATAIKVTSGSTGWCLLPADMPYVKAGITHQVITALRDGAPLAAPVYQDQRGHPVGFDAGFYDALIALDGDVGARAIVQQHGDRLVTIPTDDAGVVRDIDTPADLKT